MDMSLFSEQSENFCEELFNLKEKKLPVVQKENTGMAEKVLPWSTKEPWMRSIIRKAFAKYFLLSTIEVLIKADFFVYNIHTYIPLLVTEPPQVSVKHIYKKQLQRPQYCCGRQIKKY